MADPGVCQMVEYQAIIICRSIPDTIHADLSALFHSDIAALPGENTAVTDI